MSENNTGLLKFTLLLFAAVCLGWGFCYVVIPDQLVEFSGAPPVFHGWLRWSCAVIIALGVGAILVYRNPRSQWIFVTALSLGCLLSSLCLFWSMVDVIRMGTVGHWWFSASAAIPLLIMAVLFWIARSQAKDVLYPGNN